MSQDRRQFLRLFTLSASAATAADRLLAARGGEFNVVATIDPRQIEKARAAANKSPIISGPLCDALEVRDHGLYDCLRIPRGTPVPMFWPFFASPIGYNRPGSFDFKTMLDTNSVRGNQLPPPQSLLVERILFLFSERMQPQDLNEFCSRYFWEFTLGAKIVARAPLARCPVVGDIDALFDRNAPYTRARRQDIKLDSPHVIHLARPIHIESLMQYAFNLYGDQYEHWERTAAGNFSRRRLAPAEGQTWTASGDIEFYAVLEGIGAFSVQ